MKNIIKEFLQNAPIILDGAWGTYLQSYGLKAGECPDNWNLIYPERILNVANEYIKAGSEIILTNTFRGNRLSLQSYGLEKKVKEINQKGVQISKKASRGRVKIFASVGPCLKPFMENSIDANMLFDIYSEQIEVLANEGIDGIVLETMTNLKETAIALKAAKITDLPVVVSFTFNSVRNVDLTIAGENPEMIAKELTSIGADVIGANCGNGIEHIISITRQLHANTNLPLWIKPSAGLPQVIQKKIVYPTTIKIFTDYASILPQFNVVFIGGCCGTNPKYIKALKKNLTKNKNK